MSIGSDTYKNLKDECLIVPKRQVFSFDNLDINKGFLSNFHNDIIIGKFGNRELLQDFEFLNVWGNPQMSLGLETSKYMQQLLKRIYHEYSANGLQHLDIIQSYFIAALCEIDSIYKPLSNSNQTTAINISNKFKALVFANVKTKHLVTDYVSLINITPNHLNKLVKTITAKFTIKWIDDTLILDAKVLLYPASLTINEVAAEIGIYD